MDLKTGRLFWPEQSGPFPPLLELRRDLRCDVVIVGAGLTGALIAHGLSCDGANMVLLDKRGVAAGSTSASTALIQYEIDMPLHQLIRKRGAREAVRSYHLCRDAIDQIEAKVQALGASCRFCRRPSLYLARTSAHVPGLRHEFKARRKAGFDVAYLERCEIERQFSFSGPAALRSAEAAEIDPYSFAQSLVRDAMTRGLRVFAPVTVQQIDSAQSRVILRTDAGRTVTASKLILAAGYESTEFLRRKLVRLRSTYVLVTQPVPSFDGWHERCLIWEAGRPYHYLRTTHDRRMMIGGGDEDFVSAEKRDALIGRKARHLRTKLERMFPRIAIVPAYTWAGTFGDTKDGLPYIGTMPSARNILFALCYGANGTNFAMFGANLACDWVHQRHNGDAALFALQR
jgi:glycine/D-amino acid oxidase-like deaminating enzyme